MPWYVSERERSPWARPPRQPTIADLNALNAALAVVRWKKLCGFYHDARNEHFGTYTVSENMITNDDSPT